MPFLVLQSRPGRRGRLPAIDAALLESFGPSPWSEVELGSARGLTSALCRPREGGFASEQAGDAERRPANTGWFDVRTSPDGVHLHRDPLATLPLWVVETDDWIAVSPEVKLFWALDGFAPRLRSDDELCAGGARRDDYSPFENVARVVPCAGARLDAHARLHPGDGFRASADKAEDVPRAELRETLGAALLSSAAELPTDGSWSCLLSGGIDSSVTARLLTQRVSGAVEALSLGTPRGDEFEGAEASARAVGVELRRVRTTGDDLLEAFRSAVWNAEAFDGLTVEVLAQIDLLLAAVERPADTARPVRVATGYGADLLLGGMMRHELYLRTVGVDTEPGLVQRTNWTNELSPLLAWRRGITLHHLFWHPAVMRAGLRIPLSINANAEHVKLLLRELAVEHGWLPEPVAMSPKLAITEGSQAHELLSEALGLEPGYRFAEKTRAAAAVWRERAPR